jgi:cytochrome c biogenesis protein CcdA
MHPTQERDAKTLVVSVMRSGSTEALWPQQVAWILLAVNNRVTLRLSMDKRLNLKGDTSLSSTFALLECGNSLPLWIFPCLEPLFATPATLAQLRKTVQPKKKAATSRRTPKKKWQKSS